MFILGILSILQMIVFPGLLFLTLFKFRANLLTRIVLVFGISLLINFLLVFLLTITHLYSQISVLIIIVLELIALLWLNRKSLLAPMESAFDKVEDGLKSVKGINLRDTFKSSTFRIVEYALFVLLLVFAVTDIVWIGMRFTNNLGTVFNTWDAIISWNGCAETWAKGLIPESAYYPQLIPANWSLIYVLIKGAALQFFPKAIMPLFSLLILLMIFDLGMETRSFGFFICVIFTRLVIKKFTGEFIADGYMDLPVTFFGFASIYLLLKSRLAALKNNFDVRWIVLSGFFAAAAALTKQAGVAVLILFPLLAYVLVLKDKKDLITKQNLKQLLISFCAAFLIALAWYLYKWIMIQLGIEISNVAYVTQGIYHGASLIERAADALTLLGKYGPLLIALIPAIFLVKPSYRWLGIILVIPYSILWLFYFSYEVRNLALIFPLWGIILGLAIQQLFEYCVRLATWLKLQKTPVLIIPLLVVIAIIGTSFLFPSQRLIEAQEDQLWKILNPELNSQIHDFVDEVGTDIKVLTNYPMDYLPGLAGTKVSYGYDNLQDYLWALKNTDVQYLLVPYNTNPDVEKEIQSGLENKSLELVFSSEGGYAYRMIKIIN